MEETSCTQQNVTQDDKSNKHESDLDDHDQLQIDNMIQYSRNMTQALFAEQMHSVPIVKHLFPPINPLLSKPGQDLVTWPTRLINIKERQQFGPMLDEIANSIHPLAKRADNQPYSKYIQKSDTNSSNLQVANAASKSNSDNIKKAAKTVRALITPYMNSVDVKKPSLEIALQPKHHQPWKLYRVISGSGGWVHCVTVEPGNQWFASGSGDGLIKIYNLASGKLKLTLTGHISGVRGLSISALRPYMFSCADDKTVKCWDLEQNQIVRHYHGHLSGVYSCALHPQDNTLVTGGRDSVARVWDVRSKEQTACLTGHSGTVASILCQKSKPQIITGSHDSTIRLWDMRNLHKCVLTLTHHKKAVRTLAFGCSNQGFLSGSIDNIKQWELPDARFIQNFSGHKTIINAIATNDNDMAVSGGDEGTLYFWDWRTGHNFQKMKLPPQPGSIESEAGVLSIAFDRSGTRMITGESDKTIKMFRETEMAIEQ